MLQGHVPFGTRRESLLWSCPLLLVCYGLLGAPWMAAAISASFSLFPPPFRILWKYKRQLTRWAKKLASIPLAPCTEKLRDVYGCKDFSLFICNLGNGNLSVIYLCLLCSPWIFMHPAFILQQCLLDWGKIQVCSCQQFQTSQSFEGWNARHPLGFQQMNHDS